MATTRTVREFGNRILVSKEALADDAVRWGDFLGLSAKRDADRQGYEPLDDPATITWRDLDAPEGMFVRRSYGLEAPCGLMEAAVIVKVVE